MKSLENVAKETWVLCHNSEDVFHVLNLQVGGSVETGQPNLEQFDTEEECEKRFKELNPYYFAKYKENKEKL